MSLLSPLFLAGAIAAAIPVVLHLLRREPESRVKFAAVMMLRSAPVEHADRRRLRQLLLLALRVAALLLLALAFARPFLASDAASAASGVTMVALDTSLSLSSPGQFPRAQQLAKDAIGRAPSGHLVGVLTFADGVQIVAAPSGDRALAAAAVDAARPGLGSTRYRGALSAAAEALGGRGGTIVVVTDLQESGWDAGDQVSIPPEAHVEIADVGAPPPNLAVTAARVSGGRIVATVRNTGPSPRDVRVQQTIDGAPAGEAVTSVGADQLGDIALPAARGSSARISIDDPDGIHADNVRYLVLDGATRPAVLVVTGAGDLGRDAFYVQQALAASGEQGTVFQVVGVAGDQLSSWDRPRLAGHAAVVLVSTRGVDQRGRELMAAYMKNGGGVLLAAGPDIDPEVAAGMVGGAITVTPIPAGADPRATDTRGLAPADIRHPVFRAFGADAATLGLVRFARIAAIRGTDCQTLARFTTGEAALLDCAQGEGRALVLASDLDTRWNDFPVHATFVPFLHEALRYLSGNRGHADAYVVGSTPAGIAATPGIAEVAEAAGRAMRRIAINVDASESDPARLSPEDFLAAVTHLEAGGQEPLSLEARQQEERQNLWRYVILMVMGALVAESLVAARTA
jgi:hypothetical protein